MVEPTGGNPIGLLTFLVAPALLTNATSIMALSTSTRFGLAIEREIRITTELNQLQNNTESAIQQRRIHLKHAQQRVLMLVRAMTSLYVAVGSFAAATLAALLGAILFEYHLELFRHICEAICLTSGFMGVGGLVAGCVLLARESRLALFLFTEESALQERFQSTQVASSSS